MGGQGREANPHTPGYILIGKLVFPGITVGQLDTGSEEAENEVP